MNHYAPSPLLIVLPCVKFKMGYSPLHWAVVKGRSKVAEALIRAGANPNVADNVRLQQIG